MKTREEYFDSWDNWNPEELRFLRRHFTQKLESTRIPVSESTRKRMVHKLKCLQDFIAMKQLLEI